MIASPTTYAARFIVRRTKRAAPVVVVPRAFNVVLTY